MREPDSTGGAPQRMSGNGRREEHSAGGVVYRRGPNGIEFLVILDRYGHWGLPKGHVEATEAPADAARRECEEETGVQGLQPGPYLGTIDWTFRRGRRRVHKRCDFFLFEAPADVEARPQRAEGIREAVWLPAAEAVERIGYANTREVARRALQQLLGRERKAT